MALQMVNSKAQAVLHVLSMLLYVLLTSLIGLLLRSRIRLCAADAQTIAFYQLCTSQVLDMLLLKSLTQQATFLLTAHYAYRWIWTSQMQEDEAYVFVNYTSKDNGDSKYTPHGTIIVSMKLLHKTGSTFFAVEVLVAQ